MGSAADMVAIMDAAVGPGMAYHFGGSCNCNSSSCNNADCSAFIKWAACRVGVSITNGSWLQYRACRNAGRATSVSRAIQTKGALLFIFSGNPLTGGRPSTSHVAVSRGDGTTVECRTKRRNPRGCDIFSASGRNWSHAGLIPGMDYTAERSTLQGGAGGTNPWGDGPMPTLIEFVPPTPRPADPPPPPPPPLPTYGTPTVYLSPALENIISSASCGQYRDPWLVTYDSKTWIVTDNFRSVVTSGEIPLIEARLDKKLRVANPPTDFLARVDVSDW